ncbi:hypothetical protein AJ79_01399 [Helicocarpus griseus UAMH5409]|uniref:Type 1 phosphatases regulator n=1 Tax=Helicocarpus griseus UAMH5409 TaxID=1447875 RepID=A0A2B7Y715_9EURO|nr:hypothetical protein AJ79_01399 [Helicocarpus griseus UAMH5409]
MARERGPVATGTRTVTQVQAADREQQHHQQQQQHPPILSGRLTLRAEADTGAGTGTAQGARRGIRWAEDVVDNEGLGRKSSKVCCIYHKARPVGESSSESSSSSDSSSSSESDSDSDVDNGEARMAGGRRIPPNRQLRHNNHPHQHQHQHDGPSEQSNEGDGDDSEGDSCCDGAGAGSGKKDGDGGDKRRRIQIHKQRRRRPNAYERVPKGNAKRRDGVK